MKKLIVSAVVLFNISTAVSPVWADAEGSTLKTEIEAAGPESLSEMGLRVNPQVGLSSFEYSTSSAGSSEQKFSGGATIELGGSARKLETGLLVSPIVDKSFVLIPMIAKLRVVSMRAQSWYAKVGALAGFAEGSVDAFATLGLGGRVAFNRRTDLIIEGTFNRGFAGASVGQDADARRQGFLILTGLSFAL